MTALWSESHWPDGPVWEAVEAFDAAKAPPGIEAAWIAGPAYRGAATKIFAWRGFPEADGPVPGIVLVHGGGGTAFADWVQLWVDRGYAAVAIDTCGCTAGGEWMQRPKHPAGGPSGWGGWDQLDEPLTDQWMWHAVNAVRLARRALAGDERVDAEHIALTGVSWGGVITCNTVSVDHGFCAAVPVYGCGHIGLGGFFPEKMRPLGLPGEERWRRLWDPACRLHDCQTPLLFVNDPTDFAFPLDGTARSAAASHGTSHCAIRTGLGHGEAEGRAPKEIAAFIDAHCRPESDHMPRVLAEGADAQGISLRADRDLAGGELLWTTDFGNWNERTWQTAEAVVSGPFVRAALPAGTTAAVLSGETEDGLRISTRPTTIIHGLKESC